MQFQSVHSLIENKDNKNVFKPIEIVFELKRKEYFSQYVRRSIFHNTFEGVFFTIRSKELKQTGYMLSKTPLPLSLILEEGQHHAHTHLFN